MEFVGSKRARKRKRKRRYINSKQRRDHLKFEVKSGKRQKIIERGNSQTKKDKLVNMMEASTFWENYKVAHEWQKRHNVTWWKTRCFALEHENHVLKETIRNLTKNQSYSQTSTQAVNHEPQYNEDNLENNDYENSVDENLEFHLNEDMMDFLAQSIRHKIELKNKRESEAAEINNESDEELVQDECTLKRNRCEDAKLLYGEASSKILAMETAFQATMERHLEKTKPKFWPNIPLNL